MKVIAVLLALAASATAEKSMYAEAELYDDSKGELIGTVFLQQNGQRPIEIELDVLQLQPGSFKAEVSSERIVGDSVTSRLQSLANSRFELFMLSVGTRERRVYKVNSQLTLAKASPTDRRTSIVDHTLGLYVQNAQTKAYTLIARGDVRRTLLVTLSFGSNELMFGSVKFYQNGDTIKIRPDLFNLPLGSYFIVMREKDKRGTNNNSPHKLTKLSLMAVNNSSRSNAPLNVPESTDIHSLDDISGHIEIRKSSGTPDVFGDIIASGEVE